MKLMARGVCRECGGGTNRGAEFCSRCRPLTDRQLEQPRAAGREQSRRDPYRGSKGRPCSVCGKVISYRPAKGSLERPVCRPCRRVSRLRICEQCGEQFEARGKDRPDAPNRFCTAACRIASRRMYAHPRAASKASTRARKVKVRLTWDGVTDRQIFERDGWKCQVPGCGQRLRRDLAWPDPLSPSIDHIVPLSLGGTDTAPNKRAAHLTCNISRSNRMHPDDAQIVTPELAPLGLLPLRKPRKPLYHCAVCEAAQVKRAGAACPMCRQAAAVVRRQRALDCRERGMKWAEIADFLGLSGPGAAHNVAYADLPEPRLPGKSSEPLVREWPEPSFWWTTARPV